MPPRSTVLLSALLCWPGSALAAVEGLSCQVESAINESTGARLAPGDRSFHALADMTRDGDHLIHHRATTDGDLEIDATYRIDRATLHFKAHAIRTRHDLGEEYSVRESGRCEPATG